jgi:uncharacterized GH25 family protein
MTESKPTKRRSVSRAANINERVAALEHSNEAHHAEMMRMLSDMSTFMKDGFKNLTDKVETQALKSVAQDGKIEATEKEIKRIDSKLNQILAGLGTAAIAAISGVFTLLSKYFVR